MTSSHDTTKNDILFNENIKKLLSLIGPNGQPNINDLWRIAKDIEGIKLNIKNFGYELALTLATQSQRPLEAAPTHVGLKSMACNQADIESSWVRYWTQQIHWGVIYHRKVWELCYVLQAIYEHGFMKEGVKGIGFAVGSEPIPSLLTSYGIDVTITDLDPQIAFEKGWVTTNQHAISLEAMHQPAIVERQKFIEHAKLEYVDMNNIPDRLRDYDFCWSICSLEHLGSIDLGLDFIENSLNTLRSGGLAVHTTEFNFLNNEHTIDNWGTVLFQRKHFELIASKLKAQGHWVAELDFNIGSEPMDRYIDLPPYPHDLPQPVRDAWNKDIAHLRLMIDGFASTCFGLIIKKM